MSDKLDSSEMANELFRFLRAGTNQGNRFFKSYISKTKHNINVCEEG